MVNDLSVTRCSKCRRRRFVDFSPGSRICNGCAANQARSANQVELRIPAYVQAGGATTDLMREQLIETVIDSVFTPGMGNAGHESMLGRMRDTEVRHSPLLRHAMEAVIFSQLSLKCQDKAVALGQLQQRAQRAYSSTIGHLATIAQLGAALARRTSARSVIFTIMLMGYPPVCQQFKGNSMLHQDIHIRGQYSLLSACGPAGFDWSSKEDIDFYRQLNWTLAFTQIALFKNAMEFQLPSWKPNFQAMARMGCPPETVVLPFTVTKLPEMLLEIDRIIVLHSRCTSATVHRLDRRLRNALASVSSPRNMLNGWPSIEIVGEVDIVHNKHEFDSRIEEHLLMTTQNTIPTFFRFSPRRSPYPHEPSVQVAWITQILLMSALLRLRSSCSSNSSQGVEDIKQMAVQRATDLCRSVWHLSRSSGIAHARWVQVLLSVSRSIFEQAGESRCAYLSWTRACLAANRARVERLRTGSTSFCMAGDILGKLSGRCRWDIDAEVVEIE